MITLEQVQQKITDLMAEKASTVSQISHTRDAGSNATTYRDSEDIQKDLNYWLGVEAELQRQQHGFGLPLLGNLTGIR